MFTNIAARLEQLEHLGEQRALALAGQVVDREPGDDGVVAAAPAAPRATPARRGRRAPACQRAAEALQALAGAREHRLGEVDEHAPRRRAGQRSTSSLMRAVAAAEVEEARRSARPWRSKQPLDQVLLHVEQRQRASRAVAGSSSASSARCQVAPGDGALIATPGCRRSGPRSRPRRPSAARRGGCARRGPGGPRSCGWRSTRSARPGCEDVGVHAQAHRAAGHAPVEAGLAEDAVEALGLGLRLDLLGARARPSRSRSAATLRPATTSAAARRSPMRELVHEPMNTRSTAISSIGVPGSSAM